MYIYMYLRVESFTVLLQLLYYLSSTTKESDEVHIPAEFTVALKTSKPSFICILYIH